MRLVGGGLSGAAGGGTGGWPCDAESGYGRMDAAVGVAADAAYVAGVTVLVLVGVELEPAAEMVEGEGEAMVTVVAVAERGGPPGRRCQSVDGGWRIVPTCRCSTWTCTSTQRILKSNGTRLQRVDRHKPLQE
ncbi:hypothetical protein FA95DRAFT_662919 [Auriscalpium vulgare]|uniref:Uncharacterized protein n=1 Tax=Auriscalpium vulgare TaxID=40419 RepID=A0ACB8S0Y5_9AGAM|nr:hypothetical protein FA95DRAFT_662919 [Auriscalpium vulgare]